MDDLISRQAAIEALTGWETEPLDEDIVRTLEALPPVSQKQVTSKLKNPCDSLLKPDSDECKEQKSKLDCISREWVLNEMENGVQAKYYDDKDLVRQAPPVTPTERTGEWEYEPSNGVNRCSVCGTGFRNGFCIRNVEAFNFCPNCGAKMKGGTENE